MWRYIIFDVINFCMLIFYICLFIFGLFLTIMRNKSFVFIGIFFIVTFEIGTLGKTLILFLKNNFF